MQNGGTYFTMQKPTEIAKQIADHIRGDQIAALYVREFLSAAELVDLLGLHDYINDKVDEVREHLTEAKKTIDELRADNCRLERLLSGKAQD